MRRAFALGAAVFVAAIARSAQAAPTVQAAWSRPAVQGTTAVGFMTLVNPAARADALTAVESPAARSVQIHQSTVTKGVASMRPVGSLPVPAGGRVVFSPGGYHLMFLGLTKAQKTGDRMAATLIFASGARVKVSFVVGVTAPGAPGAHQHP